MGAVWKREVRSYFQSVLGWVFLAVFFFVFNLYFYAYNLSYGYAYLSYSIQSLEFILLIIVPVLTMRSMAEDRKLKTDQLLFTSPVPIQKIILGKYLAMVFIFSIGCGAICLCPIFLSALGTVPMGESYTAILGIWLYGVLALSIGLFISSLTENLVIAAIGSFALLFASYMMSNISSLFSSSSAVLETITGSVSITTYLSDFMSGTISITGILYYLTASGLFLFLTFQMNLRHRWQKPGKKGRRIKAGAFSSAFVALGIAIVIGINAGASQLPAGMKSIDVTYNKLYTISSDTRKILKALDQDITIYVLNKKSSEDEVIRKTLNNYQGSSRHIKVTYVDTTASPNFYKTYTDSQPTAGSLIVVSGKKSQVIDYSNLYEYDYSSYSSYSSSGSSGISAYDGEGQITSAINYVISDRSAVIYTISGHGETSLGTNASAVLSKQNYTVKSLTLLKVKKIPASASAVIINGPTKDFSKEDAAKVKAYLNAGGKVLITTSYQQASDMSNFDSILSSYGMKIWNGMIIEGSSSRYYQYSCYLLPNLVSDSLGSSIDGYLFTPYAQGITSAVKKGSKLTYQSILQTSRKAYQKKDLSTPKSEEDLAKEKGDRTGTYDIGASVSSSSTGGELTVLASSLMLDDSIDQTVAGNNTELLSDITATYADTDSASVSIKARNYTVSNLTVNNALSNASLVILVLALPIALLLVGIVIWFNRRRRM